MQHLHGLEVDPADGVLYAATHSGLWRIPESGEPSRVADGHQDLVGFAVTGPGAFLASGHPDLRRDPELSTWLGLVRSTDAGGTWRSVSLSGEADLHVLRAAHGRIYGWDAGSGRLLVSADEGLSWEERGTVPLRDLVVSPADPAALLATSEQELMRTADGGRTWAPMPGSPSLTVTAWPTTGSLYGVTPDGTVLHSAEAGATWQPRGQVAGEVEALSVQVVDGTEVVYVGLAGGGILVSGDGASTFAVRSAA
ncbi:F510_1955 family glycosylhydrolase [Geodermatophilus nigrescens]